MEWYPELEDYPDLGEAIAEEIAGDVTKLYESVIATAISSVTHG